MTAPMDESSPWCPLCGHYHGPTQDCPVDWSSRMEFQGIRQPTVWESFSGELAALWRRIVKPIDALLVKVSEGIARRSR